MLYYISSAATTTRYIEPELRTPPRRRPRSQKICAADRAPARARPRLRRTSVGSAHVRHDGPLRLGRASVNQVFERPERPEAQFPRWVDGEGARDAAWRRLVPETASVEGGTGLRDCRRLPSTTRRSSYSL